MDAADLDVRGQVVTLRSVLEERLRTAILSGRFRPGQRLPERELCALTGASRASVREALRQLEAEGIVALTPNRGPSVATMTAEEARHIYDLRAVLEGYAARLCTERRAAGPLAALRAALARLEIAAAALDARGMIAAGDAFNAALSDGSGNPVLAQTLHTIRNRLTLMRYLAMTDARRVRDSFLANRAICEAILSGDAAAAEALCVSHIHAAGEIALGIVTAPPAYETGS